MPCSLYYIQIWGMSYNEDVYIGLEFTSARLLLGETTGTGITAIATICMVLVIRVKDKAYIFIKRRFPSIEGNRR